MSIYATSEAAPAPRGGTVEPLLDVSGLTVDLLTPRGTQPVVRGIGYQVLAGQTVGLVGESGSGKTLSVMALLGLHPGGLRYRTTGSATFEGQDLLSMREADLTHIRGVRIGVVFQDPMAALNPLHTVGDQIAEVLRIHRRMDRGRALRQAADMLAFVGIPEANRRLDQHPHQFSGGMRQRVMIAMALIAEPRLLIADEPTTALDVTVQAQILELLMKSRDELGMAMILITHDLGLVAGIADAMAIMYAGRIVEHGPTEQVMGRPDHPYTAGLLASIPRLDGPRRTRLRAIPGLPPARIGDVRGCAFAERCAQAGEACLVSDPILETVGDGHISACLVHPFAGSQRAVGRD